MVKYEYDQGRFHFLELPLVRERDRVLAREEQEMIRLAMPLDIELVGQMVVEGIHVS